MMIHTTSPVHRDLLAKGRTVLRCWSTDVQGTDTWDIVCYSDGLRLWYSTDEVFDLYLIGELGSGESRAEILYMPSGAVIALSLDGPRMFDTVLRWLDSLTDAARSDAMALLEKASSIENGSPFG
jgi:hypothetical protein